MTRVLDIGLVALFVVATSIWVGGLVVIAEVAHATRSALTPEDSVPFFRTLGRTHGVVGSGALLVALVTGGVLLRHHRWDGALVATAVVAVALVVISVIGMAQARRMTGLRQAATEHSGDPGLRAEVARGARRALVLRGVIALLTLALLVLGAALAA